jgi:hypothetical protein
VFVVDGVSFKDVSPKSLCSPVFEDSIQILKGIERILSGSALDSF